MAKAALTDWCATVDLVLRDGFGRELGSVAYVPIRVRDGTIASRDGPIDVPVRLSGTIDRIEGRLCALLPYPPQWFELTRFSGQSVTAGDRLRIDAPLCTIR